MQLASFFFFTALVAFITWRITRRDDHQSSSGYFLGGRRLTGVVIAGSLLLTNLSTEQLVGLNGAAFADGLSVMAWEVLAVLCLVAMALFFLPRYLRSGIATIPQFLELRFAPSTRAITTVIFLIAYAGILLPIILYSGAVGLIGMMDLGSVVGIRSETGLMWFTVWLVGIIGSIYALFGGLRAVAVSDTLNGVGLLTGGLMIVYFGLCAVSPEGGMWAGLEQVRTVNPERFNSIGAAHQSVPFSTLFSGVMLLGLFYWCTNQQIIQRAFGASSLREGQKGVLLCGAFKLLGPLYLVLPGIIAYHLYAGSDAGMSPDTAYGRLVRQVLPAPLTGFFAAVMIGAILSSFNSALNSAVTLYSLDIYKARLRPDASEEQVVRSGKWFGWIIAILAMCVAPLLIGQTSIFGYLQKMNGLYFIPIFAVVVVGMLARRVPAIAADIALVLGFSIIALGYFVPPLAELVARLHDFHFLGLTFAFLVLLMLVIGALAPRAEAWVHRHSGEVELTPWRWAIPVSLVLVALVFISYVVFADFAVLRSAPAAAAQP